MIAINTINGGELGFNSLLYKPPTESTLMYLNNHMQNAINVLGDAGTSFINTTKAVYDKFNSQAVINAAKALVYSNGVHLSDNYILPLTVNGLQTANYSMQQYIMANPVVGEMVADNMCYGFQDTYYDNEPGVVGTDRNDYRRAVDGLVQFDEDLAYVEYYSSSDEAEDLSGMETFAIQDTWDSVEIAIASGIDPTSPDGDEL